MENLGERVIFRRLLVLLIKFKNYIELKLFYFIFLS